MPNDGSNGSGQSRLDRVEMLLNQLADEHVKFGDELKHLLTAQVVLTERVDKNAIAIAELIEAQKHTDQRLNALITVVDGLIRTPPQAPPQ